MNELFKEIYGDKIEFLIPDYLNLFDFSYKIKSNEIIYNNKTIMDIFV